jgi:hypothetical protein
MKKLLIQRSDGGFDDQSRRRAVNIVELECHDHVKVVIESVVHSVSICMEKLVLASQEVSLSDDVIRLLESRLMPVTMPDMAAAFAMSPALSYLLNSPHIPPWPTYQRRIA